MTVLFTEEMLAKLRLEYSRIEGVNPTGPTFPKMVAFLDKLPQETLKQLAGANIKFISKLALNRVVS